MEQTLIILKPDTVCRGLIGEVTTRLEKTWLKLVWCKMNYLSTEILESHYAHLVDKPFFGDIVAYMQSGSVLLQVWEGSDAAALVRKIVWVTNPLEAQPGTIRGDFSLNIARNIIHASENSEEAKKEVVRFFKKEELMSYTRCDEDMIYEIR